MMPQLWLRTVAEREEKDRVRKYEQYARMLSRWLKVKASWNASQRPLSLPEDYLARAMVIHETTIRVRYGETDQMGFVYYGNYAGFFEVARVEALRSLGFPYKRLEDEGVMLPVHDLHITYHRPAGYDDVLTLRTRITSMPGVRIVFAYEVLNALGELLTEASTTLVFVDRATMRPRRAPQDLLDRMRSYFE